MMPYRLPSFLTPLALASSLMAVACSGGEAVQATPGSGRGGGPNAAVPVATATVADKAIPL